MRPRMFAAVVLLLGCTAGVAAQTAPAGVVEYYHVDALGSVRAVTSATGAIVRTHHYHPFGEGVESGADPMRFAGKPRDAETGLDYFGARYYASRTGRLTTVDPALDLEGALVDPQRWNRHTYALNNPLKFTDPDGKNPLLIMGGAGAAVFGGWQVYQNLRQGRPWHENVGVEASKGLIIGATLGLAAPAIAGTTATEMGGLASTGATTGRVVIGQYPRYLELAGELGAKRFNIPPAVWEKMSDAQRLAANNKFLDRAIARGDTFMVTMSVNDALQKGGVWLKHEIEYLLSRGYTIGKDGMSLIPLK